ncbi:MAG: alpha/beta fold hydrolase [Ruminococcus flavefaciens]|nr:alpha/beta fold hydrolase [Ruminococcus flavefaciens]MCM1232611.1 alpha/beta fold hydrolase [Ruminococcus flavefaciens]
MTLFFLPHAGGSARSYCSWKRYLPKDWNVVPLEPRGRGSRSQEDFCRNIVECATDLLEKYGDKIHKPYVIFGHSMGSMLAVELTRQIIEKGLPSPEHVFLSGRCAVDTACTVFPKFSGKTDEEIISFFLEKGLFMEKNPANEQLWNIMAEILCADVRMTENYYLSAEDFQFPCNISIFYGKDDYFLQNCDMEHWSAYTCGKCRVTAYDGGHFYCNDIKEKLCSEIVSAVNYEE